MKTKLIIVLFFLLQQLYSQHLKPYFDKSEYEELLLISVRTNTKEKYYSKFSEPKEFNKVYRSNIVGLDNLWELWIDKNQTKAVISIRGTIPKMGSAIENMYAAMISAKGEILLSDTDTFKYELSPNNKAAVHIGWLIGMAYLSKDIIPKIDSIYKTGIKDILLMGHSQGGAINYLLTAYLYNLQDKGFLPKDIRFKTYCSAAPKPGNLYFAYYYGYLTQNGWGFNVVNSADWVPETPITIQTLNDFNNANPFVNAKSEIKKLKFPKNIVLKSVYNKLDRPTKKAQKNYEKYLGEKTSKIIMKNLDGYTAPSEYFNSNNYVRAGTTIILYADDKYFKEFPDKEDDILIHHMYKAYLYLLKKL
jgi:hypothetical protein